MPQNATVVRFDVLDRVAVVTSGGVTMPHTAEDAADEQRVLDAIGEFLFAPSDFSADDVSPVRPTTAPPAATEVHSTVLGRDEEPLMAFTRLRIARELRIARAARARFPVGEPTALTSDALVSLDTWVPLVMRLGGKLPTWAKRVSRIHISEARYKDGNQFPHVWAGPPLFFRRGGTMRTLRYSGSMTGCSAAHGHLARAYEEEGVRKIAVAVADADELLSTDGAAVLASD